MSTAFSAPHIWPFPVGYKPRPAYFDPPCKSCPDDTLPGSEYCLDHRGDDPDYEPTDAELGANPPSDPGDSPSYTNLTYPKGNTK